MSHLHFDVKANGFYGVYWACVGGADCAVIAMKERLQGMENRRRKTTMMLPG